MEDEIDLSKLSLPDEWQKKLEAGMSIGPFHLDVPMTVNVLPTGAIRVSCPCMPVVGSTHPVTLLLEFSPLAAKYLKQGFAVLETLPDGKAPEVAEPAKQ